MQKNQEIPKFGFNLRNLAHFKRMGKKKTEEVARSNKGGKKKDLAADRGEPHCRAR